MGPPFSDAGVPGRGVAQSRHFSGRPHVFDAGATGKGSSEKGGTA
jgi:hypothetical protein